MPFPKRIKRLSVWLRASERRGRLKLLLHFWSNAREPFNLDSSRESESARSIREFRSPRRRVPRVRLTPYSSTHPSPPCPVSVVHLPRFPRLGNSTVRDPMESLSLSLLVLRSPVVVDVILENNALPSRARHRFQRNRRPSIDPRIPCPKDNQTNKMNEENL